MPNAKNKKQDSFMDFIRSNLPYISALLVALLNIWLASKLAPIATDVALTEQRVYAIERIEPISSDSWKEVIERLNRIENKIDTHISLH